MKSVEKQPSKRKTTQPRDSSTGKFVKSPDRKPNNQKRRSGQKGGQKGGRKSRSPSPTTKKNAQGGQHYHKK